MTRPQECPDGGICTENCGDRPCVYEYRKPRATDAHPIDPYICEAYQRGGACGRPDCDWCNDQATSNSVPDWELRVVGQDDGRWTVLDGYGWAGSPGSFATEAEADAWLSGYNQGAAENM